MSKRQNHRINKLTNRVTRLERILQNKGKSKKTSKGSGKKASRFTTTLICVLGWWDFFLLFQCVIPNKWSLILLTLVTAITIIVPVFYQDKIKGIIIKSTEVWGLILLLFIVSIILIGIIYLFNKYHIASIVYLLNI